MAFDRRKRVGHSVARRVARLRKRASESALKAVARLVARPRKRASESALRAVARRVARLCKSL